jgi:molybdopterin molybdotransferase
LPISIRGAGSIFIDCRSVYDYFVNAKIRGVKHIKMIGLKEALDILFGNIERLDTADAGLSELFGMVLAEEVFSDIDIPPFDKSAMDGYAVRSDDLNPVPKELKLKGTIAAGSLMQDPVKSGECAKIMTGAPLPAGADAVVMKEVTQQLEDGRVRFSEGSVPGKNVCVRGEDIRKDQRVLEKGTLLRGPEIAVLSSVGKSSARVYRKPTVSVLSTGSEIVEPDEPLREGKIRNSNGPMLVSLLGTINTRVHYLGISLDREEELVARIKQGLRGDMLLISGGVSVGDYDLIPVTLEKMGADIKFHRVKVKPGKPILFAKKGDCTIIGIPGNPVSNFTTFNFFVKPALYKMMGREDFRLSRFTARLTQEIVKKTERSQLVPSFYQNRDGLFDVTPLKLNGSADIIGCSGCNCLILIEEDCRRIGVGHEVSIMPLNIE